MVNFKAVAAVFVILTVVLAASTTYLLASPVTVTQTVTASAPTPTVKVAFNSAVGVYLTNATGWALYQRQTDVVGNVTTSCTGACVGVWPLFYSASIVAPPGISQSAFGSFKRTDGRMQSTYNGLPLYYFARDKAGTVNGVGVGNFYAAGSTVLKTATASSSSASSTTAASTSASSTSVSLTPAKVSIPAGASTNKSATSYAPPTITVVIGVNNSITWTNNDNAVHTVDMSSVPAGASTFNSNDINPGGSYTVTLTVAGTYKYHCDYHPWMAGTVNVVK